jgi:hypothetical protein
MKQPRSDRPRALHFSRPSDVQLRPVQRSANTNLGAELAPMPQPTLAGPSLDKYDLKKVLFFGQIDASFHLPHAEFENPADPLHSE